MRCAALVVVALALAAPSAGATASGLTGVVTRGPITPVCRVGVPCSAPAKNELLVFRRGAFSRSTRTGATGRYRILLPPGRYVVTLTPGGMEPAYRTVVV